MYKSRFQLAGSSLRILVAEGICHGSDDLVTGKLKLHHMIHMHAPTDTLLAYKSHLPGTIYAFFFLSVLSATTKLKQRYLRDLAGAPGVVSLEFVPFFKSSIGRF